MIVAVFASAWAFEPLQDGWPKPVHDRRPRGMFLVDQMEYRYDAASTGQVGLDAEGWWGPDFDRLRYRLEGAWDVGEPTGEGEAALLYSRLVSRWLELQVGVGGDVMLEDERVAEGRVELGVEYVVPQDIDVEAHLRVSHRGRVSLKATATKDWMFTQRLILQTRSDLLVAAQPSVEKDRPRGLESVGAGLRLRYEARRELAPYVGGTYALLPPGPSGGGIRHELAAVGGLRWWL
jgi:copper resistance protein B